VLEEDGRPQTITYFSRDTDLPLTLGLLVERDLSHVRHRALRLVSLPNERVEPPGRIGRQAAAPLPRGSPQTSMERRV